MLACCNPIPPLVRQQLNEVHQLILRARVYQGQNKVVAIPRAPSHQFASRPLPGGKPQVQEGTVNPITSVDHFQTPTTHV